MKKPRAMEDEVQIALAGFQKMSKSLSEASIENFKKFKPQPDDVILFGVKSGTTWAQQIMHGLRSRGNMDFDEMNSVIPVLEFAHDDKVNLDASQQWKPRCFKTMLARNVLKDGPKYIAMIRDPKSQFLSFFDFYRGWMVPHDMSLEVFTNVFLVEPLRNISHTKEKVWPRPTFHQQVADWWPYRNDKNVLWLHYEDLKEDLAGAVKLIATFMGLDSQDKELLEIATTQASFHFMKENEDKYLARTREDKTVQLGNSKVNIGCRDLKAMPGNIHALMDDAWKKTIGSVSGFANYEEMRNAVNKELKRPWAV